MADQNKNTINFEEENLLEDSSELFSDNEPVIEEQTSADNIEEIKKDEGVFLQKSKIILAKKLLKNIQENNERLLQILSDCLPGEEELLIKIGQLDDDKNIFKEETVDDGKVIEGVFDGENMIGPDGKQYSVPANYASKSKLVEGDILKLIITSRGHFIYKQIGPAERTRIVGVLEKNNTGEYLAVADGKKWRLLTASVTYYKGEQDDEIVILVPKAGESKWAAVENVVRKIV